MDYSPVMRFENIISNMEKTKALTKIYQIEKHNVPLQIHHALVDYFEGFPCGDFF